MTLFHNKCIGTRRIILHSYPFYRSRRHSIVVKAWTCKSRNIITSPSIYVIITPGANHWIKQLYACPYRILNDPVRFK